MRRLKNIIWITILLALTISVNGQGRYPFHAARESTPNPGATYTDDFELYTSTVALGGQGDWVSVTGILKTRDFSGDTRVHPEDAGWSICYYNDTFDNDQYAFVTADNLTAFHEVGVAVRCSPTQTTAYIWAGTTTDSQLMKFVNGSRTDLDISGNTAWVIGYKYKLEVTGTTLSCYVDSGGGWVLDTSVGSGGSYVDGSISSGFAGVAGYNNHDNANVDDWEGGDL